MFQLAVNLQAEVGAEIAEIELQFLERPLECADISGDGKLLATGTREGAIVIWDIESGRRLRLLRGHVKPVQALAFSPSGDQLVSVADQLAWIGGQDETKVFKHYQAVLWDVTTGKTLQTFLTDRVGRRPPELRGFTTVAFSPYGSEFVTGDTEGNVVLWQARTGRKLWSFRGLSDRWAVSSVDIDASGDHIVATDEDQAIVWSRKTGRIVHRLAAVHAESRGYAAFSGDGKIIVTRDSRDDARRAVLWDAATGRRIREFAKPEDHAFRLALNSDASRCLIDSVDHGATLWDTVTGERLGQFDPPLTRIVLVKFVNDVPLALDSGMKLVDVAAGNQVGRFDPQWRTNVDSLAFSADGKQFAIGTYNRATIWDVATGQPLTVLHNSGYDPDHMVFSPNGKLLLGGNSQGDYRETTCLWDIRTGMIVPRFPRGLGRIVGVGFSRDGSLAMSASIKGKTIVWDGKTGEVRYTLLEPPRRSAPGARSLIMYASFSPCGRYVATGAQGRITLWDLSGDRLVKRPLKDIPATIPSPSGDSDDLVAARFDPEGSSLLALTSKGRVLIWDPRTGDRKAYFRLPGKHFLDAEFFPEGERIVTVGLDDCVRIVNLKTQSVVREIKEGYVRRIAVSPDGRRVVSGTNEGTTRMWDVATGKELAAFYLSNRGQNWLTITPEGYFAGTPAAKRLVMRRAVLDKLAVEPCEELYQPDWVAAALAAKE